MNSKCVALAATCSLMCPATGPAQIDPAWHHAPLWNKRYGHTLTLDPARQKVVLFGGLGLHEGAPGYRAETYEWDGSAWVSLQPNVVPPMRIWHAAAYDPVTRAVVVFGGQNQNALSDTWLWDGHVWRNASPRTVPPARYLHSMGTDWLRGYVVLYGGMDGTNELSDTWLWSGTDWVPVPNRGTPPSRIESQDLAFDIRNGGVLLYGGYSQFSGFSDQTWCFDGQAWRQILTSTGPGELSGHAMSTEPSTGDVLLFGGGNSSSWFPYDKTWRWNGSAWSEVVTAVRPQPYGGPAMAHDGRRFVLFGGSVSHAGERRTWGFAGNAWSVLDDPDFGFVTGCVYESARDQVLVFQAGIMQTHRDDILGPASPTPLGNGSLVLGHHAASGLTIAWTFSSAGNWIWNGQSWRQDAQLARNATFRFYDNRRAKLVATNSSQSEFHTWDPANGWAVTTWQGGPDLQRYYTYPVWGYDAARDRAVVYVPRRADAGETWEWDGVMWHLAQALTTNSPGGARRASMVYSPALGGLVYGAVYGVNWTGPRSGLLLWDGSVWRSLTNDGLLVKNEIIELTYDTQRNRLFAHYSQDALSNLRVADIFPLRETNRYPRLGETVAFEPRFPSEAGLPMVVALSHDSHPGIPLRLNAAGTFDLLPLASSPLLSPTVQVRILDGAGHGQFLYPMPSDPVLLDRVLYAAGLTVRGTSIGLITNSSALWFRR